MDSQQTKSSKSSPLLFSSVRLFSTTTTSTETSNEKTTTKPKKQQPKKKSTKLAPTPNLFDPPLTLQHLGNQERSYYEQLALPPWRRNKEFFPNIRLVLQSGGIRSVPGTDRTVLSFRLEQRMNKLDIKAFLTQVYGFHVVQVNTVNYDRRLKRNLAGNVQVKRRSFKRAYVTVGPPPPPRLQIEGSSSSSANESSSTEQQNA